jgi:preprotein translocase SecE subunit
MARQTRSQRRERRAQTPVGPPADGARARSTAPARAAEEPRREPGGHLPGAGGRRFLHESVAELKKVEWPNQTQLITGTTAVLIACVIVGIYLYAADRAFAPIVDWLIGT